MVIFKVKFTVAKFLPTIFMRSNCQMLDDFYLSDKHQMLENGYFTSLFKASGSISPRRFNAIIFPVLSKRKLAGIELTP